MVVGFPSAGVHANGFSLVRQVLETEDYDGDDLLAPTRLYLDDVRALRRDTDVRALAHVTGGGIEGNLSRVLPEGLRARRSTGTPGSGRRSSSGSRGTWTRTSCARVFNLGIGYCAVVAEAGGTAGDRARSGDRRPRLRRGHEPAGADRRGPADRRGRVEQAWGARARAGARGGDPGGASVRRRERATGGLARGARRARSSSSRATCGC